MPQSCVLPLFSPPDGRRVNDCPIIALSFPFGWMRVHAPYRPLRAGRIFLCEVAVPVPSWHLASVDGPRILLNRRPNCAAVGRQKWCTLCCA